MFSNCSSVPSFRRGRHLFRHMCKIGTLTRLGPNSLPSGVFLSASVSRPRQLCQGLSFLMRRYFVPYSVTLTATESSSSNAPLAILRGSRWRRVRPPFTSSRVRVGDIQAHLPCKAQAKCTTSHRGVRRLHLVKGAITRRNEPCGSWPFRVLTPPENFFGNSTSLFLHAI